MKLRSLIGLGVVLAGLALLAAVKASTAPLWLFQWAAALGMTAREAAAVSGLTLMLLGLAAARRR
ncbi:MAG: hypothetical protein DRJ67_05545 [Thermoprotei archaeon]|nr:MAG: hypothetical protein DRJ67_05545 [Thermoprotei archaeon]